MKLRDTLSEAVRAASSGGDPALVAFLTAGFPSKDRFREHLQAVAAGADVVEIGVPFTDPMADGVTIQRSSHAALAQGVNLRWIFSELEATRVKAPLVLMSYLNPLLAFGLGQLADAAARANVAGFIVPDLPLDEGADLRKALDAKGVAMIQMVTPVTKPERLKQLCEASQGFVYAVTMTGTTGKNVSIPIEVVSYLDEDTCLCRLRNPQP
jgi:tryptophan synthase alpha chain